ncbi:MAG: hypothetical protein EXR76_04225 [Myxococcales bacterium]|nr:hypothetical protein [Myxococcales bacterium]
MADKRDVKKDDEDAENAPVKSGPSKMPMVLAIVNTLALGGLAAFVVLSRPASDDVKDKKVPGAVAVEATHATEHGDEDHAGEHGGAHGAADEAAHDDHAEPSTIVGLGVFIINLKDPSGDRYLKAKIGVEVLGEGDIKKVVEERTAKVRYEVNMILSNLKVADVSGPQNMEALRKVILVRAKKALAPEIKVIGVWPEEWVIQ